MIRNTFIHLDGMGEKTEQRLWADGVLTWDDFLRAESIRSISAERKADMDAMLTEARKRLALRDAAYFREALKTREHWRLYGEFREHTAFLDIETNGLAPDAGGYPTMVGIATLDGYRAFVRGRDLTTRNIMDALDGVKCLVTFFGTVFDMPFLMRTMPGFEFDLPHFDLCFGGKKIGLSGGLKAVEKAIGIARPAEVDGMDGYAAVLLWNRHLDGYSDALKTLVAYNREDTVNLITLADKVYAGLCERSGLHA
jgi:hypothetical protein